MIIGRGGKVRVDTETPSLAARKVEQQLSKDGGEKRQAGLKKRQQVEGMLL